MLVLEASSRIEQHDLRDHHLVAWWVSVHDGGIMSTAAVCRFNLLGQNGGKEQGVNDFWSPVTGVCLVNSVTMYRWGRYVRVYCCYL